MFKVKIVPLQRLGVLKNETIDKTLANFTKQNAQQKGKRKNKTDDTSLSQKSKRVQTRYNDPLLLL